MLQRPSVDSFRFAQASQTWRGEADIRDFARLAEALPESRGPLLYEARGFVDRERRPCLEVGVETVLTLVCQRCLGTMPWPLKVARRLYLARTEGEAERLEAEAGQAADAEVLAAPGPVDLAALVEDEVLLGLPLIPRHEERQCPAGAPVTDLN